MQVVHIIEKKTEPLEESQEQDVSCKTVSSVYDKEDAPFFNLNNVDIKGANRDKGIS